MRQPLLSLVAIVALGGAARAQFDAYPWIDHSSNPATDGTTWTQGDVLHVVGEDAGHGSVYVGATLAAPFDAVVTVTVDFLLLDVEVCYDWAVARVDGAVVKSALYDGTSNWRFSVDAGQTILLGVYSEDGWGGPGVATYRDLRIVPRDCDGNGVDDVIDIQSGVAIDADADQIPDDCAIAADVVNDCDGDGRPDRVDQVAFLASGPGAGVGFLGGVAADGEVALVAGSGGIGNSGTVHVFRLVGTDWVEEALLQPSDSEFAARFGASLDIVGDRIAVGAPGHSELAPNAGAAYVFERLGGVWTEVERVVASDGLQGDRLGTGVALDGDWLLASAKGRDGDEGAVYAFELESGSWVERQILTSPVGEAGDAFGRSIVSRTGHLAVSMKGGEPPYAGGRIDLYELDGAGAWNHVDDLEESASNGPYGSALSLGTVNGVLHLVVGSPEAYGGTGRVEVRSWPGVQPWDTSVTVYNGYVSEAVEGEAEPDRFGAAVALRDGRIVVGVPGANDIDGTDSGRLDVFEASKDHGNTWARVFTGHHGPGPRLGSYAAIGEDWFVGEGEPTSGGRPAGWSIDRAFCSSAASPDAVSANDGGEQVLRYDGGPQAAGLIYLVLGTASGKQAAPGLGQIVPDPYWSYTLTSPNAPPLQASLASTDPDGRAEARFQLPPGSPPGLVGLTFHHHFVVLDLLALDLFHEITDPLALVITP